ncbi:MAG TPA: AraC family transcriptional regulator, partial [bacterium]|nr:AraC family transcriptional regulator [bacterium]
NPAYDAKPETPEPILLESLGFYDIFMPIRRNGKRLGTLLCGAFSKNELTLPDLKASWKKLTGREAGGEDLEFREFAKVMLETPLLEGPVLSAFREALGLFARVLVLDQHPEIHPRLQRLVTEVFSKNFYHSYWMDWALGLPTRQATPLWNLDIEDMEWVRQDIGVSRIPTTVITVVPKGPRPGKHDPVEEMVRVSRFQRRSFRFAQTLAQTVSGKLENYGAVFVTSADPALGRPQRRAQILETAERIRAFAAAELGGPVLVGVGETVAPGEVLTESYRQAVLALHMGRGADKEIIAAGQAPTAKVEGVQRLMRLLQDLRRNLETGTFAGWPETLDGFLRQVLTLSFQNPEEIRWHLQYSLAQMQEVARTRTEVDEKDVARLYRDLAVALERTGTTQEMILAFKDALEKLLYLVQGRSRLEADHSIERVKNFIAKHFRETLKISHLAKMAGTSVSTFSRRFKKSTGVGFEKYLQNLRLEEARRLLALGSLPIVQVAKACGFKPGSYFSRFFRQRTGLTPEEFRKKSQRG